MEEIRSVVDTPEMSDEELISWIDTFTRQELPNENELRAVVKELRKRIQGGES